LFLLVRKEGRIRRHTFFFSVSAATDVTDFEDRLNNFCITTLSLLQFCCVKEFMAQVDHDHGFDGWSISQRRRADTNLVDDFVDSPSLLFILDVLKAGTPRPS
jgi:hypothetical protein